MSSEDTLLKEAPDRSIITNIVFCSIVGSLLLGLFLIARKLFREVYCPNVLNAKRKLSSHLSRGRDGKFISSMISLKDDELLPWVGLDAFVFLQTIKLAICLIVFITIPAILILGPIYYFAGSSVPDDQWIRRISIIHVSQHWALWFTLLFNYYIFILVFYGLYIFYRRFSIYRQAFLRSPGSWVSQVSLRRMAKSVGGFSSARKLVDLTRRTIVVSNLSTKYRRSDILRLFEEMGFPDVHSAIIVKNRKRVRGLLIQRNNVAEDLEKAFSKFYKSLLSFVAQDKGLSAKELESTYSEELRFDSLERRELLRKTLNRAMFAKFRPTHKDEDAFMDFENRPLYQDVKEHGFVDSITVYYKSLLSLDDSLLGISNQFASNNERFSLDVTNSQDDLNNLSDSLISPTVSTSFEPLIRPKNFCEFKTNLKDYGLTVWGTSMSVIIIFGSQWSASVCRQALLSSRPFSMEVFPAPTADDIIWENLYLPKADRFVRGLLVSLIYIMLNVIFTTANVFITGMLTVEFFESYLPVVSELLLKYPFLRDVLKGILAPFFYNVFLWISPFMLYGLSIYQGSISKTEVQESLLRKYTWFLFLQFSLVYLLRAAFIDIVEYILTGNYGEIIVKFQAYLPVHAAFCINLILQRAAISMMLVLLKPVGLVVTFIGRVFSRDSPRALANQRDSDRVSMGSLYPEHIVFVLIISLAFISLSPPVGIASLIFYLVAYMVFRYHFIFSYEIPHESGGRYWMFMPTPILVGCLTGQLFTVIHFYFHRATLHALLIIPLLIATVGGIVYLRRVFSRRSVEFPLSNEATGPVIKLSESVQDKQMKMVMELSREAGEEISGEDRICSPVAAPILGRYFETVPYDFGEAGSRILTVTSESQYEFSAVENPYCNPIMYKRYPFLYLPPCFFHVLRDAYLIIQDKPTASPL